MHVLKSTDLEKMSDSEKMTDLPKLMDSEKTMDAPKMMHRSAPLLIHMFLIVSTINIYNDHYQTARESTCSLVYKRQAIRDKI